MRLRTALISAAGIVVASLALYLKFGGRADVAYGLLGAMAAGAATVAIASWVNTLPAVRRRREAANAVRLQAFQREVAAVAARRTDQRKRRRIAELRGDPVREKYIARIEAGDFVTDEEIAYWEQPSARVTCGHLRPWETGLREAGIAVRPFAASRHLNASCLFAAERVRVTHPLAHEIGEDHRDGYWSTLSCKECRSAIGFMHPYDARPDSPVFPPA